MIRKLPKTNSSGYTIIEIIVSLFIIIILFSVVTVNYRQYILKKNLDAVANQMVSDIKLAQSYALAGKVPPGCTNLKGYIFRTSVGNNSYSITADCDSEISVKTVKISSIVTGISLSTGNNVRFNSLGNGTSNSADVTFTLQQQTTSNSRSITIMPGGAIK